MADFFKGLTGGFQSGLQLGEAMRAKQEREALAAIMQEKPTDVGPDFAGQFRMPGLEQGPMPQAEPIQDTQSFMGQQYAQSALTPEKITGLRYGAMADVIAQRDPAAALRMRQEQVRMQREAELAPLQLEQLKGSIAGQAQQRELAGIQLSGAKRTEAEQQRATDFAAFAAENPNATTADLKKAAFEQFKFTPKQWQDAVNTRLGIKENEQKEFVLNIKDKLKGKNLAQLGSLYNTDPDFDDKTDLAIVPGKGGAVTLNFIDKASGRVTSTQSFKNEAMATEYLNKQATEPETIGTWMLNLRKTESGIEAQDAAIRASDATVGLRGAQAKQIRESADNANARADLVDKFEALTDEEKAGAKGQGLIKQFNLLNVKAGGTVPLGTTPKAAAGPARELSDLDKENLRYYRDWVKDPKNSKLPQGQKDAFAAELGVTQFIKRDTAGPQAGIGSNPYAAPQQGVDTTRAPAPSAAPRPAPMRGPSDLSTVDIQRIRSDAATLDAAIAQVQAQASAVVRSGDTNAIKLYGDRLNALRAQRQALTAGLTGPAIQSVGLQ